MADSGASGLITTPFGAESTAAEVVKGIDLAGKRAIVTGAASGIGVEIARALAGAGAEVWLAVRDTGAGERTAADIRLTTGNPGIHVEHLELADLASVAAFASRWAGPLHMLINNAGLILPQLERSPQGWEMTLATNYLGHFALAVGLHDALAAAGGGRIVSLSSRGHLRSPVIFEDMNFISRPYDPTLAYGQSKTALILLGVEATRRWSAESITANAANPGAISATGLTRHMDPQVLATAQRANPMTYLTPEQGAATPVLVATSPRLTGIGGRYFEEGHQAPVVSTGSLLGASDTLPDHGVAAYALDPDNARRLWDLSLGQVG
jgi:NAD(P)-dependent dehydrogenase (short-subunit alcohol dehydrogenase family)